ncbi:MAG: class E sortase [Candidatus Dormibacteraeota bacterium]|nr:class E sortase [Candidatus Dormibacteraeota bacterium]
MTPPIAVVQPPVTQDGTTPVAPAHVLPAVAVRRPEQASAQPWSARAVVQRVALIVTAAGVLAGLLLAYEFSLSSLPQQRLQAELLATFKQAVPTTTLDIPSTTPADGTPVALLRVPRRGIAQVVVEGSSPSDLKLGPGHLSASPMPGEYGNAVIAGRRTTYGAPFGRLPSLRRGDAIYVTTGQGAFTYIVSKVEHASSSQPDVVDASKDSRLTLFTSDPALIATGRLAVVAKLQGDPIALDKRPATLLDAGQLGLAGDPIGLALGIVWLNALIAVVVIGWRLRHRLPRSVLYLFAAPVITTLALLMFANLDSLLPGTM